MKSFLVLLLLGNLVAAAWILFEPPVDVVREAARSEQQIAPGSFHLLSDAEVAQRRAEAERKAAAAAAAASAAAASLATVPVADLPLASCIDILGFSSEAATKKLRARLAAASLVARVDSASGDKPLHLRLTGLDGPAELQVHALLKEFPRLELSHCAEAPASH